MAAKVAPLRIGSGAGFFWAGVVALLIGVVVGMAGSGPAGDPGAAMLGTFLVSVGVGLWGLGFWASLAHRLEHRLAEIQAALVEPPATPEGD